MSSLATQPTSTASPDVVVGVVLFLGLLVTVLLSTVILARGVQGYRHARNPALLGLSVGILFISGLPIVLNITLSTLTALGTEVVTILATVLRLAGLGIVLYVIYGTGGGST